jgi:GT2 family glycosyltransferase
MGAFDHLRQADVEQPMGAALMVKSTVINQLGGFDSQLGMFFNDVDLCRRILTRYRIVFYPKSQINHYKGHSIYPRRTRMLKLSHHHMRLYLKKYADTLPKRLALPFWYLLIQLILIARLLANLWLNHRNFPPKQPLIRELEKKYDKKKI